MRGSTILGMIAGLALLATAVGLTARDPSMFVNLPGLVIVLGGTLAATLMSYSLGEIWRALKAFFVVLRTENRYKRSDIQEVIDIAKIWHRGSVHDTDAAIQHVQSPFLRTGLQMVIDGAPTDQIVDVLDWRIGRLKAREFAEADVFNVMAVYAPAFGMVGTLLGLVNMLRDIGANIDQIAVSLALALVTTFYGIVLANAVFKPMAVKLRRRTQDRVTLLTLTKEAIVMMADQHGPAQLKYTLQSFLGTDADGEELARRPGKGVSAAEPHHGH
jgi:chemotaxis protein MotA